MQAAQLEWMCAQGCMEDDACFSFQMPGVQVFGNALPGGKQNNYAFTVSAKLWLDKCLGMNLLLAANFKMYMPQAFASQADERVQLLAGFHPRVVGGNNSLLQKTAGLAWFFFKIVHFGRKARYLYKGVGMPHTDVGKAHVVFEKVRAGSPPSGVAWLPH